VENKPRGKTFQQNRINTGIAEGQKPGAALLEDEENLIDHSKSSAFIVQEYEF